MVQYVKPAKPFPRFIPPMDCLRTNKLPEGQKWIYEVKWDGYRTEAVRDGREVMLYSDQGNSHTDKFPVIMLTLQQLRAKRFVLDGEVVALDENRRPSFQEIQNWRTTDKPIVYFVFDILPLNGKDLIQLPLSERREILDQVASEFEEPLRISQQFRVRPNDFVAGVKQQGLEGVVAKNEHSVYESGKRTGSWQKQRFGLRDTFPVGGFIPGRHGVDELLIGEWRQGKLYFLQRIRTGMVQHTREALYRELAPLQISECPFVNLRQKETRRGALTAEMMSQCTWVKAQRSAELEFVNRTRDGRLRHPEFRALH
jgi:DNA ligase D-like protein (predicted ligase)